MGEADGAGTDVLFATARGIVKKTPMLEYSRPRTRGIIAINLAEDDELIAARPTTGQDQVALATRSGQLVRFNEGEVRAMGRGAAGVRGCNVDGEDAVVAMEIVRPAPEIWESKRTHKEAPEFGKGIWGRRMKTSVFNSLAPNSLVQSFHLRHIAARAPFWPCPSIAIHDSPATIRRVNPIPPRMKISLLLATLFVAALTATAQPNQNRVDQHGP